jgi:hypothetical protein
MASRQIAQFRHTFMLRAMIAAEHAPLFFEAVTDYAHTAMLARMREQMDSTFETVERIGPAALSYATCSSAAAGHARWTQPLPSNAVRG